MAISSFRAASRAALALLDAVVRLLPGVMGKEASGEDESFESGLLEYPQYTRPQVFEGREIPAVLTSGDHAKVRAWRRAMAEALTKERRPDLVGEISRESVQRQSPVRLKCDSEARFRTG